MADILIRGFEPRKDLKEIQMLVGMSAMEQLAIANRQGTLRPHSTITSSFTTTQFNSIRASLSIKPLARIREHTHSSTAPLAKQIRFKRMVRIFSASSDISVYSGSSHVRYRLVSLPKIT